MNGPILNLLAVDPGDIHQGVAYFEMDCKYNPETERGDWSLILHWTRDLSVDALEELTETASVDAIVIEEFRLYPDKAREQGYSDFKTTQRVAVVDYICRKRGIEFFVQGASIKRLARAYGRRSGLFPHQPRMRDWDFNAPSQHERDAIAHGVWWTLKNKRSPMYDLDSSGEFVFSPGGVAHARR